MDDENYSAHATVVTALDVAAGDGAGMIGQMGDLPD